MAEIQAGIVAIRQEEVAAIRNSLIIHFSTQASSCCWQNQADHPHRLPVPHQLCHTVVAGLEGGVLSPFLGKLEGLIDGTVEEMISFIPMPIVGTGIKKVKVSKLDRNNDVIWLKKGATSTSIDMGLTPFDRY